MLERARFVAVEELEELEELGEDMVRPTSFALRRRKRLENEICRFFVITKKNQKLLFVEKVSCL